MSYLLVLDIIYTNFVNEWRAIKEWKTFDSSYSTPIIKQYIEIKRQYEDCVVFFQIGDFYEIFFEDSIISSSLLGLMLTKKSAGNDETIAMCGIPLHSYENYIGRLVKEGYKIAICEQLETPLEAKKRGSKLVQRQVTRVVTTGTLIEENLLDNSSYNYLMSLYFYQKSCFIAWIDISTGDFFFEEEKIENLNNIVFKINPKEILIADNKLNIIKEYLPNDLVSKATLVPSAKYNQLSARNILEQAFKNQEFLFKDLTKGEIIACGVLIDYVFLTQKTLCSFSIPQKKVEKNVLRMDSFTRKSLEISNNSSGDKQGSLKTSLDNTATNMGSRQLGLWLNNPLIDTKTINERLSIVEYFLENQELLAKLREILKNLPDFERAISRISFRRATALDLVIVKESIKQMIEIKGLFFANTRGVDFFDKAIEELGYHNLVLTELDKALNPNITVKEREKGFIKVGYDSRFDKLNKERKDLAEAIEKLQQSYVIKLKIPTLKIVFNQVQGYFIEVPNKSAQKILEDNVFKHKQSLTNNTRYTTEELIEKEGKINTIEISYRSLEKEIFEILCNLIIEQKDKFITSIKTIAEIDILSSFALRALENNFCKPKITNNIDIKIKNGRHIVVEESLKKQQMKEFIANDCVMNDSKKIYLITGPNMAGKSTFLRQNAIIIIMAQIGSYVPADYAEIGIVDAIFSRVGANDDLSKGQSTFMVEMLELATILNYATERSFLILDEIGRGTSTYDGLSIAWSTLEYLNNVIRARVLFATHYHELTELEQSLATLKCYYVEIQEHQNKIVFMHNIKEGYISKSYGIEVGKLAGIPASVIKRAKALLKKLEEKKSHSDLLDYQDFQNEKIEDNEEIKALKVQNDSYKKIFEIMETIDIDNLSSKEALDMMYDLNLLIKESKNSSK